MGVRHRIKLPDLGESVEKAVVVQWHSAVGDRVVSNDPLLTVETDKVDTEVPVPVTGNVVEILAPVGTELAVGDPVCIVEA